MMAKAKPTTAARRCETSQTHADRDRGDERRTTAASAGPPLIIHEASATKSTMLSCTAAGWATRLSSVDFRAAADDVDSVCSARSGVHDDASSTTTPSQT